ncbi:MAG: anion permease [Calditrichaeota bacterium]|nr:MAG: anion permease [Calditrichota bacterium]
MSTETVLLGLALLFGFYMAWSIGANDVANAMGTSVGSGALTLKRAVILAALLEFSGALFVGSHVSETVRKGIVNLDVFTGSPLLFVYGMLAALLAAAAWLQLASYYGWPVSTTHSIVGSIIGFGIVYGGMQAIHWDKVTTIVASWVVSPLLSGAISFLIFSMLRKKIFYALDPVKAAKQITPVLVFVVFSILTLVMVFKGLKNLHLDLSFGHALEVACSVGLVGALTSHFLVARIHVEPSPERIRQMQPAPVVHGLEKAVKHLQRAQAAAVGEMQYEVTRLLDTVGTLTENVKKGTEVELGSADHKAVERIFVYLQILSASFVAFAHGANDVANAIGPLSAVLAVLRKGIVELKAPVPVWVLAMGGLGICFGLATWGWRVIETVGKRITELTPSRGFSAEFGAATTIVVASKLSLPVSTTHTLVGAVLGVGLARGIGALNLGTVRDIIISWLVTLPAGAGMAILFFYVLKGIFG